MQKKKKCQGLSVEERVFLKALVEKNQERELSGKSWTWWAISTHRLKFQRLLSSLKRR